MNPEMERKPAVDAIVLAGAPNAGPLKEESEAPLEALIEIDGRPMVSRVLDALKASGRLGRIAVVGPPGELAGLEDPGTEGGPPVSLAGDAGGLVDNIQQGFDHLQSQRPVLIVTSDIPLLTAEAVNDFLDRCGETEADVYYPIISREDSEARYPGAVRTYARLADGEFTGGNCVLLAPEVLTRHRAVIEQAVGMRKSPVALSRLFGLTLFLKLLTGRLRIRDVEGRFRRAFGLAGAAVRCRYPEIGLDVDKPSDLELVRRMRAEGSLSATPRED